MGNSKKNRMKGGDNITLPTSNSIMNWFSNTWNNTKKNSEGLFNKMKETTDSLTRSATSLNTPTSQISTPSEISSSTPSNPPPGYSGQGGKKKRNSRKKGGGPEPVHGLNVAKPTYYLNGGKSRKRCKSLKRRKYNKKR